MREVVQSRGRDNLNPTWLRCDFLESIGGFDSRSSIPMVSAPSKGTEMQHDA